MTGVRYCSILEAGLLSFLKKVYPKGAWFQQDSDPKRTSRYTKDFLEGVNWWRTRAESPDLNPVENVWVSMKYYLRQQYKPRNLESLINGIKQLWKTMTPELCKRYIGRLQTVMPKVIAVKGAPGYWFVFLICVHFSIQFCVMYVLHFCSV